MEGSVRLSFVSASCNKTPRAAAWGSRVLAYGSASHVCVRDPVDPVDNGVRCVLSGHADRVNAVAMISSQGRDVAIISGSADSTVRIWLATENPFEWTAVSTPLPHGSSITAVAVLNAADGDGHVEVAAASGDAAVTIWRVSLSDGAATKLQTISLGTKPALCLAFTRLPCGGRLLAVGGVDRHVRLYAAAAGEAYAAACVLPGHMDWVSAAQFATMDDGRIMLATGSQDRAIRLWVVGERDAEQGEEAADSLLTKIRELMRHHETAQFTLGRVYSIRLDALLSGHDDWVRSVHWSPRTPTGHQPPRLLTASTDKTAVIWEPDPDAGVWIPRVRLGEVGGQNNFGFLAAHFGPDAKSVVALGFNGALHLWRAEGAEAGERWSPRVICGGHFGSVVDAAWDTSATYLATAAADQTTRIFAQWRTRDATWADEGKESDKKDASDKTDASDKSINTTDSATWFEVGRAQVHGHDMACLAFTGSHQFVSGAEEKVLRVFDAPTSCLETLANIVGQALEPPAREIVALTAHTPALGLSNKAVVHGGGKKGGGGEDDDEGGEDVALAVQTLVMRQPPFEENLMEGTLWAESEKLYGHGYELFSVAADHSGHVLASASKASQSDFSAIRLWDTTTWLPAGELRAHTLTTTQMAFSPDDTWLLSVSRDRSIALSRRAADGTFAVHFTRPKMHARIIWGCAWAPTGLIYATASRDGEVKLWRVDAPDTCAASVALKCGATAVAFAPCTDKSGAMLLVVGAENGRETAFFAVTHSGESVSVKRLDVSVPHSTWPAANVNRLAWRYPRKAMLPASVGERRAWELAVAADDASVRIVSVDIERILETAA